MQLISDNKLFRETNSFKIKERPFTINIFKDSNINFFIDDMLNKEGTELSKLLTSCLTAVKNHVIRYCEKVYERSGKNLFLSVKHSGEVLNKLNSRGFRATNLSTYDFSTL